MKYSYDTKGVCPSKIDFEIIDGKVYNVKFTRGCDGNLKAISKCVEGKTPHEINELFKDVTCGHKNTSCSNQLGIAVLQALEEEQSTL